jgi:hypothetical protein
MPDVACFVLWKLQSELECGLCWLALFVKEERHSSGMAGVKGEVERLGGLDPSHSQGPGSSGIGKRRRCGAFKMFRFSTRSGAAQGKFCSVQ